MTYYKITKAYPALMLMVDYRLPVKKALTIYKMAKKAQEIYEFSVNEERKYMEEFNGEYTDSGEIKFSSQNDYDGFKEKIKEVRSIEAEWGFDKLSICEEDIKDQTLPPRVIMELEEFISFE